MKKYLSLFIIFLLAQSIYSQESFILKTAEKELNRAFNELKKQPKAPYYISYHITDTKGFKAYASFGKLQLANDDNSRNLDIDLRVGDYNFDNTHLIRGERFNFSSTKVNADLPLDSNETAIANAIWYATDKTYKKSIEALEKAKTNKAVKIAEEDSSADFSKESPAYSIEKITNYTVDKDFWTARIKKLSQLFEAEQDWIFVGQVSFSYEDNVKYFVTSEGTKIQSSEPYARIFISASTKAEDGMSLPLYKSYFAFNPKDLPSEEEMLKDTKWIIETLRTMRKAPLMTTYTGPAILSGSAAGVFFHEIFGHRVEGHRLKDPNNSQTFKNSIGEKIFPENISVVCDPTINTLKGNLLSGYYKYDDEGVKAQKVQVLKDGIFKNFLMSRSPIQGFDHSNGHGRAQEGYKPVSRQSNLVVECKDIIPIKELKKRLIKEAKKQDKEYGLLFDIVQGGFTFTGRAIPNSFNVSPVLVYKIYVDGRPDEIVRGVDLIGTPLTTFSNIIASGDDLGVFNGVCGAESGGVPVSACSPSLLVSKIEVQKKQKSQAKLPILECPTSSVTP